MYEQYGISKEVIELSKKRKMMRKIYLKKFRIHVNITV